MEWIALVVAGLFEMGGVLMINQLHEKRNWQSLLLLVVCFGASFFLLAYAMVTLPMGTAYAIWTGIGAAGGAIAGMFLFNEPKDWKRVLCVAVILSATIGLNLVG